MNDKWYSVTVMLTYYGYNNNDKNKQFCKRRHGATIIFDDINEKQYFTDLMITDVLKTFYDNCHGTIGSIRIHFEEE